MSFTINMNTSREVGIKQKDENRWWRMIIEDNESGPEVLTFQSLPTERENEESHHHHHDDGEKDNKNITEADSQDIIKNVDRSEILINNGLLCSIIRAISLPTSYPDKKRLAKAILRDSNESEIKRAWTDLFTSIFPYTWEEHLNKVAKDTDNQDVQLMVQDIINLCQEMVIERTLPNFVMPWWYKLKLFETDKERGDRSINNPMNKDNQMELKEVFKNIAKECLENTEDQSQPKRQKANMELKEIFKNIAKECLENTMDQSKPKEQQTNKHKNENVKVGNHLLLACPKCIAKKTTCQCLRCEFCNSYNHLAQTAEGCQKKLQKKQSKLKSARCYRCEKNGHLSKDCQEGHRKDQTSDNK